jgi:hypothetical protein
MFAYWAIFYLTTVLDCKSNRNFRASSSTVKSCVLILAKNGLGYILGVFLEAHLVTLIARATLWFRNLSKFCCTAKILSYEFENHFPCKQVLFRQAGVHQHSQGPLHRFFLDQQLSAKKNEKAFF